MVAVLGRSIEYLMGSDKFDVNIQNKVRKVPQIISIRLIRIDIYAA